MFTFSLTGRSVIWCGGLPRVSLRLPWAMNFCPFRACPLKRALIEGKLRSVGKIFPCRMPHSTSPHSHISHTTFHTQHITFHILNTPPPNLHYFSHRAPPRVQKHHSQRIFATAYHSAAYRLNVTVRRSPLGLPHHETPSFDPPSLPFRGSIPYLSHLDP